MASPVVYDAVRAYLEANYASTLLLFENERTDTPPGPWVLIEFISTTYAQQSLGAGSQAANRWDEDGTFFAHVVVPGGSGVRDAFSYARIIADLFRGLTLVNGNLEFMDVVVGYGESQDEGNWYRVSVNVAWRLIDSRE